jgi:opacity protein-like surface antigen
MAVMIAKHISTIALVAFSMGSGITSASAQSDNDLYAEGLYGWYEAGPALVEEAELRDFFGTPVAGTPVKFDTGFHFGIGIGQELTRFLKVELQSGYNYNALKSIGGATAASGNLHRVPIMGNVVLQFPNRTGLVPVIGAGAGGQWLNFDAQNVALGLVTLNESSDTWVFSYQAYAGLRYEFSETMSLGLFYHYNVADGPSWEFDSVPAGNLKLNSIRTHSLSLTLGWMF